MFQYWKNEKYFYGVFWYNSKFNYWLLVWCWFIGNFNLLYNPLWLYFKKHIVLRMKLTDLENNKREVSSLQTDSLKYKFLWNLLTNSISRKFIICGNYILPFCITFNILFWIVFKVLFLCRIVLSILKEIKVTFFSLDFYLFYIT